MGSGSSSLEKLGHKREENGDYKRERLSLSVCMTAC